MSNPDKDALLRELLGRYNPTPKLAKRQTSNSSHLVVKQQHVKETGTGESESGAAIAKGSGRSKTATTSTTPTTATAVKETQEVINSRAENMAGPWFCSRCETQDGQPIPFPTYRTFRKHLFSHGDPIDSLICQHCGWRAEKRSPDLLHHLFVVHNYLMADEFPKCTECDHVAMTNEALQQHLEEAHQQKPPNCHQVFEGEQDLHEDGVLPRLSEANVEVLADNALPPQQLFAEDDMIIYDPDYESEFLYTEQLSDDSDTLSANSQSDVFKE